MKTLIQRGVSLNSTASTLAPPPPPPAARLSKRFVGGLLALVILACTSPYVAAQTNSISNLEARVVYAADGAPQVSLTWDLAEGGSVIQIARATNGGAVDTTHSSRLRTSATATSALDTMVEFGNMYDYQVLDISLEDNRVEVTVGRLIPTVARITAPSAARPSIVDTPNTVNISLGVAGTANSHTFALTAVASSPPGVSMSAIASEISLMRADGTAPSFTAPALTQTINGEAAMLQSIALTFTLTVTATGGNATDTATIVIVNSSGDAVGKVVLPEILRQIPSSVNRSIYERILARQRRDGRWE